MSETRKLPFPEFPGESPEERTRRHLATHPEMLDRVAYNYWLDQKGAPNTVTEHNAWTDLPPEIKQEWKDRAWRCCEEYWAASPAQRTMMGRASLARELDRNAARADVLLASARQTTGDEHG